ncbi:MAG: Asp-tRNA(Asn)/Glu-tRNA(Gln) amidotransferase subunit GatC [Chloroflexi bacterium]|jgi:aspartyl-tRNA(Asn)/glutamyl-tRNA(Gln) amidotransferase subunit C|nr:Asp-tRNA(Asn)/Glu-tRNA(Gln) amidotransferase subunit GatC [Chloroflexota bacterium]
MSLTKQEVEKIAHLARLALTEQQKAEYQRQLSAVLDYADMLDELDLSDIKPTAHAVARENVMRDDVIVPGLVLEDVLFNSARHAQDQFQIQSVLED